VSRPSSPRAARLRDWRALRRMIEIEQGRISPRAHLPLPEWPDTPEHRYLHALQKTLEGRDASDLLAMLDKRVPVSPLLLPIIAEVIRDLRQGRSNGRPAKLLDRDHESIRREFDAYMAAPGGRAIDARHMLADRWGVSQDTIKRSLKMTAQG
jgi:hypothetical protein